MSAVRAISHAVERAETADLLRVVEMAKRFHAYGVWRDIPVDDDAFSEFALNLIENGAVFMTDTGLIGGMLSPFYFAPDFLLGVEFFWWAPDGDGQLLRKAFEDWARENGASAVQFSAMGDDHIKAVTRIYRMAGYEAAETAFVKRL